MLRVAVPSGAAGEAGWPTPVELERFRDYVHEHSGIFVEADRAESLRVSLMTRASQLGFVAFDDYFRELVRDDAELQALLNLVTINETSFFRFPAQFEVLATHVVPEVLDHKPGASGVFRAWSAGCSSGEEPYSIAMTLLDAGVAGRGYQPQVVGTDISTEALDRAGRAVYSGRSLVGVRAEVRARYFEAVEGGHRVASRVRDLVDLNYHNLIKEPYPLALTGNWDAIFCRNVTIYFRLESTRRVIRHFYDSLNPGGYLFVGHSETLTAVSDEFEPVEVDGVFLYRKPYPRRLFVAGGVPSRSRRRAERAPNRPETHVAAAPAGRQPRRGPEAAASEAVIETHLDAAHTYANAGDFPAAIASCRRALNANPLSAAARYILGVIYQRLEDTERAIAEFKRTICIDPDFVLAHFHLANVHRGQRECTEAVREYEGALEALSRSPEGEWSVFLDGFTPEILAQSCERAVRECKKLGRNG